MGELVGMFSIKPWCTGLVARAEKKMTVFIAIFVFTFVECNVPKYAKKFMYQVRGE